MHEKLQHTIKIISAGKDDTVCSNWSTLQNKCVDIQTIEIYRIYLSTSTNMGFAHHLLVRVAIEVEPINHIEQIHFVLLIFHPRHQKLHANNWKLRIMMGILEQV